MLRETTAIAFLLVSSISFGSCQTFQYSRGWTNGKRTDNSVPITTIFDYKSSALSEDQLIGLLARCANQLHKMKLFLHPNDNQEVCRIGGVEFAEVLRECLRQDKAALGLSSSNSISPFRRSSETSTR